MFAKTRVVKDPAWNQWANGSGPGPNPVHITPHSASQLLTVYGCVTRIADVMATMSVDHFTRRAGQQVEMSGQQRASWLDLPNNDNDWAAFMTQIVWSLLIDGNAFLVPIRSNAGRVLELYVLEPTSVHLSRSRPGFDIDVTINGQPFLGELLHIPAYLRPGEIRGVNPIENARIALGLGLSAQEYGAGFFGNSAIPSLVIKQKGELTPEQAKTLKESWGDAHRGSGKGGGLGVLGGDADIHQLTIAPEQAQFLETRRFSAAEIAANLFHVPSDMVGVAVEGSSLTYQNMETRWTEFLRSACQPWMTRIERAVSRQFLPRPQFIKFVPDVYLRADTKTRYETHAIGVRAGFLLDDEARDLENLPPLSDEQREQAATARQPSTSPSQEGQ